MNTETLLFKMKDAINARDIESFVECFSESYASEQPVHPDRAFSGRDQVRKNWSSNFNEMPDFSAQLLRYAILNNTVWTEWEWQGTRRDNSKMLIRGVMILGVEEAKFSWGRLYIEPVDLNGKGIDASVTEVMLGKKVN